MQLKSSLLILFLLLPCVATQAAPRVAPVKFGEADRQQMAILKQVLGTNLYAGPRKP